MTFWRDAEIETYYADESPSDRSSCEVRIDGGEIAVSIHDDHTPWLGTESGLGHYTLSAADRGHAVLHRSPDSNALEGYWIADGWEGMCRIVLNDAD
jgi:hypothetical protein